MFVSSNRFAHALAFFVVLTLALGVGSLTDQSAARMKQSIQHTETALWLTLYLEKHNQPLLVNPREIGVTDTFVNLGVFHLIYHQRHPGHTGSSGTFSQFCIWARGLMENLGLVIIDYQRASVAPRIHFGPSERLKNSGGMLFRVHSMERDGGHRTPLERLVNDPDVYIVAKSISNPGCMRFIGSGSNIVTVHMDTGRTPTDYPAIENSGVVTLENAVWRVTLPVSGTGCVQLRDRAHLLLDNPELFSRNVKISVPRGEDLTVIDIKVPHEGQFELYVNGFYAKNIIRFSELLQLTSLSKTKGFGFSLGKRPVGTLLIRSIKPGGFEFDGLIFRNKNGANNRGYFTYCMCDDEVALERLKLAQTVLRSVNEAAAKQ